jgi:outer membrane immunogenic protein
MELTRKNMLLLAGAIVLAFVGYLVWTGKALAGDWNGVYVGVGASYNAATVEDTFGADGVGAAGVVGYDARIGRFVPGVFAEWGYKTFDWAPGFGGGVDVDVTSWVAGGRLGFLVSDTAMLFASLGYTQGDADVSIGGFETSVDLSGYVVGGGAELNLDHGFFLRPEYRLTKYTEIDDEAMNASVHEGRLVLVYKFGGTDPLINRAPLK